MTIDIAFSPCPNDTFLIAPWISGKITSLLKPNAHYLDIQELNARAKLGTFDIIKMSAFCFSKTKNTYDLLPVGSAIGMDVGPKLIAKNGHCELNKSLIAHPGVDTTAYALLRLLFPEANKLISMRYDTIEEAINAGHVDAGIIIHESRFTFAEKKLIELYDLGVEYIRRYNSPIPLGVVCAKKSVPVTIKEDVVLTLQRSYDYAMAHRNSVMPFVKQHAQEMQQEIIGRHIDLYVTQETRELSRYGRAAIDLFVELVSDTL